MMLPWPISTLSGSTSREDLDLALAGLGHGVMEADDAVVFDLHWVSGMGRAVTRPHDGANSPVMTSAHYPQATGPAPVSGMLAGAAAAAGRPVLAGSCAALSAPARRPRPGTPRELAPGRPPTAAAPTTC